MTIWLAESKLPHVKIPFHKTNAEEARLTDMAAQLLKHLPGWGSLYISPKDAQEHFVLTAKVCWFAICWHDAYANESVAQPDQTFIIITKSWKTCSV